MKNYHFHSIRSKCKLSNEKALGIDFILNEVLKNTHVATV